MRASVTAVHRFADRHRGLLALSGREVARVTKLWTQTIVAPVLSSALFILVFGLSIGGRIRHIEGFEYKVFIVPGLITMAMAQAAYANNSATVFQARFDRYINDVLSAPMRSWEVNLGLNVGGVVRALAIGTGLLAISLPLTGVPIREPLVLVVAVVLMLGVFCTLGVVVGVYANSWDHTAFITNIVILPLTFLGGVFYSVDNLPSPWQEISHVNPIFFLVNAMRYGFLGSSDVPVGIALGVTAMFAAVFAAWSAWLFRTGRRLKP
jgi:ABC-2 type transport system permease protein